MRPYSARSKYSRYNGSSIGRAWVISHVPGRPSDVSLRGIDAEPALLAASLRAVARKRAEQSNDDHLQRRICDARRLFLLATLPNRGIERGWAQCRVRFPGAPASDGLAPIAERSGNVITSVCIGPARHIETREALQQCGAS